jgi:hypothetical protein
LDLEQAIMIMTSKKIYKLVCLESWRFSLNLWMKPVLSIRIQWGPWIRIQICNPDPGVQKWSTKIEKS